MADQGHRSRLLSRSDARLTAKQLSRYADEGVRVVLAAYGTD